MIRRLASALALLAAPALAGCGNDLGFRHPVHPAAGKITWKGEPVKGAMVRFNPVDPRTIEVPAGEEGPELGLATQTGDDGTFVMSAYYADDGAPAGDYVVTVTSTSPAAIPSDPDALPGDEEVHPDDLSPAQRKKAARPTFARLYSNAATSPLKATVKPGEPNQFTFELDAVDSKSSRGRIASSVD